MLTLDTSQWSRSATARAAGGLYLSYIVTTVIASIIGHIGFGDADELVETIRNDTGVFRFGLVVAFASAFLFLLTAWCLYLLLRPVDPHVALLFLLLNAVGVAIQCAGMLPLIAVVLQGEPASGMDAFSAEQLTGLALLSASLYKLAIVTAQVFFSTWLVPLGYLVYRSGFLPRALGVLLIVDGFADLFWFLQAMLLPDRPALSYPSWAIGFVAELGLALWLVISGASRSTTGQHRPRAGA